MGKCDFILFVKPNVQKSPDAQRLIVREGVSSARMHHDVLEISNITSGAADIRVQGIKNDRAAPLP